MMNYLVVFSFGKSPLETGIPLNDKPRVLKVTDNDHPLKLQERFSDKTNGDDW